MATWTWLKLPWARSALLLTPCAVALAGLFAFLPPGSSGQELVEGVFGWPFHLVGAFLGFVGIDANAGLMKLSSAPLAIISVPVAFIITASGALQLPLAGRPIVDWLWRP